MTDRVGARVAITMARTSVQQTINAIIWSAYLLELMCRA
jgi:hypothetical protein